MSVGRKVFHCVVDDTALTTNISEIKKWTSVGAITLIVPLYTLERLRALKKSGSQVGMNAREAVRFLDRVTSGKHDIPSSKVALQGPMEQFEVWEEVEKFFLPEFEEEAGEYSESDVDVEQPTKPFENHEAQTEQKEAQNLNEMSQMLLSKLNFKKERDAVSVTSGGTQSVPASLASGSSRTSPEYASAKLAPPAKLTNDSPNSHRRSASGSVIPSVPATIKPLLSAVLWRLHAQPDVTPVLNSCILVTNDRTTQTWAQKFGITAKNIHQLRTAIIYEEKEYKNHCKYLEKNQVVEPERLLSFEDESDEDVLVFVPRGQAKSASRGTSGKRAANRKPAVDRIASASTNVTVKSNGQPASEVAVEVPSAPIDPDSFSRNFSVAKPTSTAEVGIPNGNVNGNSRGFAPSSPRGPRRGASRGGSLRGSTRGRGKLWVP
ncbi:hypothetical protein FQN50_006948 [Emmonsiellopsis sp. PD_5]|nr:hypothetical protein FQN50_006948 [Emmonsiellopsis sp. PD_5]